MDIGFTGALKTLTRIPLPDRGRGMEERTLFWFPFVGLLIGGANLLIAMLPFGVSVNSVLVLVFYSYITRAFHLDGLMDLADGLGGGWTKERALSIMKDPHVGAFGVIAIVLVLLLQYALLQQVISFPIILLFVPMTGRLMQVYASSFSVYARSGEGTASNLVRRSRAVHSIGPTLQVLLMLTVVFFMQSSLFYVLLCGFAFALLCTIYLLHLTKKRLGGITGDVLGAIEVLGETSTLLGCLIPLAFKAVSR